MSPSKFFASIANPVVLAEMFDVLPDVCLFIKDHRHRYMKVNQAELRMHGCDSENEMIGRTDFDFNPPVLAAHYVDEDRRVMQAGRPLLNQTWLVQSADGMPRWYISSKYPIAGRHGRIIGIAGVMRLLDQAGGAPADYARLTAACEYVLKNYGRPMVVSTLARRAHLSVSQLNREFHRLFHMSPSDYIVRVRLLIARRLLEETSTPIGDIALECGFYDQSHFSRAFSRAIGLSPRAYRLGQRDSPGQARDPGAGQPP